MEIDAYLDAPEGYVFDRAIYRELESVSHREYCTGFYFDDPMTEPQLSTINGYIREKAYFATALSDGECPLPEVLAFETENGRLYPFVQRNKVSVGDGAEIISPRKIGKAFTVTEIYSEKGEELPSAPHPGMKFFVRVPFEVTAGDIMRAGEDK
jgi:putative protease